MLVKVTVDALPALMLPLAVRRYPGALALVRRLGHADVLRFAPAIYPAALGLSMPGILRAVGRRLAPRTIWELDGLSAISNGAGCLRDGLARAPGWRMVEGVSEGQLSLRGGWHAVQAALGGPFCERTQRGVRRAVRDHGGITLDVRPVTTPDEIESILDAAREELPSLRGPHGETLSALLAALAPLGRLRIARGLLNGELAAASLAWCEESAARELLVFGRREPRALALEEQVRLGLMRYLVEVEPSAAFLLPPGDNLHGAVPTLPQLRFVGVGRAGVFRAVAPLLVRRGRAPRSGSGREVPEVKPQPVPPQHAVPSTTTLDRLLDLPTASAPPGPPPVSIANTAPPSRIVEDAAAAPAAELEGEPA